MLSRLSACNIISSSIYFSPFSDPIYIIPAIITTPFVFLNYLNNLVWCYASTSLLAYHRYTSLPGLVLYMLFDEILGKIQKNCAYLPTT